MQKLHKQLFTGGLWSAGFLLWASSSAVLALDDITQCVELTDRQPVELELNVADNYANCFTLVDVALESEIAITSMTELNFGHQVNVYAIEGITNAELIGSYNSNERSLTQVSIAQNGKPIVIEVSPAERSRNKHLKVQYLQMGTQPQVVIELVNQS